jgi:hypothetical protein
MWSSIVLFVLTFAIMGLLLGFATIYDATREVNGNSITVERNLTTDLVQQSDMFGGLFQSWLQAALAVAAIVISIYIYRHKEVSDRNNVLQRSYQTLLMELEENKPALEPGAKHQRVRYPLPSGNEDDIKEVSYTNAFLDVDAYESILYSGNITYLPSPTQKRIIMLYQRIKKHNEVLSWTNQFEDMFFLDGDTTNAKLAKWHSEVKRYEKNLTKLEIEILPLMNKVIEDIRASIKPQAQRRIPASDSP